MAGHDQAVFVDYRKLVAEPRDTVHEVYAALGLTVSPSFDAYLRAQQDRERNHQSRFTYNIDDYAVSVDDIEGELSELFDEYQWPRLSRRSDLVKSVGP